MNKGLDEVWIDVGHARTRVRWSPKSKISAIRRFAIDAARCTPEKAGGVARGWPARSSTRPLG
jgi:hypothetical protein